MQRRIVFCADDLGISPGTNAGIRAAAMQGLVKETSFCVTGIAAKEGAQIAKELAPTLSVGLHLTFTLGRSLTGPLHGLTDDKGNFLPLATTLKACLFNKTEADQVAREVEAQLTRLADLGVKPSHLNGHHHVHCFPGIRESVIQAMSRWKIRWTRLPRERVGIHGLLSPRRILLARFANAFRAPSTELPMRHLPFVGLSIQDRADYRRLFLRTVDSLPAGDYEWMVHPRAEDDSFARLDHLQSGRGHHTHLELAALTDPEFVTSVVERGVQAACFADIQA